jgi:hypothetical protein
MRVENIVFGDSQKVAGVMYLYEYRVPADFANEYLHIDEGTTLK